MFNKFDDYIANFNKINSDEAEKFILSSEEIILFIGRASCPFCNIFVPKINNVARKLNKEVKFLNSEDFTDDNLTEFREKYNVKTVPGLIVSKKGNVKVVCDSSLSEDDIEKFITV